MLRYFLPSFCLSLLLFGPIQPSFAQSPPPTIEVIPELKITDSADVPGGEYAEPFVNWKATNCDYVLILGLDTDHHPTSGKIRYYGSLVFVAVGPGGTASQSIGGEVHMKPFPGRHGVLYNLQTDFKPDSFFRDAYKQPFVTSKSLPQLRDATIAILQNMQYTAAATKEENGKSSPLIYTVNFNPNRYIKQKPGESAESGLIDRQIAYVVSFEAGPTETNPSKHNDTIYVLPIVRMNHPKDDDKWKDDPDGLQLGIPACSDLAKAIMNACP